MPRTGRARRGVAQRDMTYVIRALVEIDEHAAGLVQDGMAELDIQAPESLVRRVREWVVGKA